MCKSGKCDICDRPAKELKECEICGAMVCWDCIEDGICDECAEEEEEDEIY